MNELKIDKSFVMAMDHDKADRAIVASTAALGRSLGLRVVAEGVESAMSASVLTALGVDLAQGFHYSPPVPAAQLPGAGARGGRPTGRRRVCQSGVTTSYAA